jgi:transposase-like protein
VATDADRLRAERLYIEGGKACAVIAADIGVHRSTVYEWRREGDWDAKRSELSDRIRRAVDEVSVPSVAAAVAAHRILSRAEGLGILAEIALDRNLEPRDRTAAIKLASSIDAWGGAPSDDGDGPPARVVFQRSKRGG